MYEFGGDEYKEALSKRLWPKDSIQLFLGISQDPAAMPVLTRQAPNALIVGDSGMGVSNATGAVIGSLSAAYNLRRLQILYADAQYDDAKTFCTPYQIGYEYYSSIPNLCHLENCKATEGLLGFLLRIKHFMDARYQMLEAENLDHWTLASSLPKAVVVIDNVFPYIEKDARALSMLKLLLRTSGSLGVHFLFTGTLVHDKEMLSQFIDVIVGLRVSEEAAAVLKIPEAANITERGVCVWRNRRITPKTYFQLPLTNRNNLWENFRSCSPDSFYNCTLHTHAGKLYLDKRTDVEYRGF